MLLLTGSAAEGIASELRTVVRLIVWAASVID